MIGARGSVVVDVYGMIPGNTMNIYCASRRGDDIIMPINEVIRLKHTTTTIRCCRKLEFNLLQKTLIRKTSSGSGSGSSDVISSGSTAGSYFAGNRVRNVLSVSLQLPPSLQQRVKISIVVLDSSSNRVVCSDCYMPVHHYLYTGKF